MRLAVNGWRTQGARTGIARYLLNLVRRWTPECVGERFEGITFYCGHDADPDELGLPANVEIRRLLSGRPMLVWENTRFATAAAEDVAFHPSFSVPLVRRGRAVVTTHDMVSELHPELFPSRQRMFYNRLYRWSATHATLVITDSNAARTDIVSHWGIPEERVRVVYLAPDDIFGPHHDDRAVAAARDRLLGGSAPYLLFVGKFSGRRNVPVLLEAYAELRRRQPGLAHKLVMVGQNMQGFDVAALARSLRMEDGLVHHEHVSDEDLAMLYRGAEAYVTPSVYETTSLPVLEAQISGAPVVTIDTVGMREVTGEAALLIPRLGVRELADAMESLMTDRTLRARLAEEGARSVARFTWDRAATATLDILAEAAGSPGRRVGSS
jgi:glycosyltransferase involved in cell wall biosynthesis